jgi:energy-coupling factor transporter ATP-binding protein EcfA2
MKLIRSVRIERFRSLANVELKELSDFVVLVGPNNSGKSNVLRALNLFFNDETDPNSLLDFAVDYHLGRSKPQKRIAVSVEFSLPAAFGFNKKIRSAEEYVGRHFYIRKAWTLETTHEPTFEDSEDGTQYKTVDGEGRRKVRQFLDLISFRYIPNRAVPAAVVRNEWSAVQAELARRVGKRSQLPFDVLKSYAKSMIQPFADDIKESLQIGDLELATPMDLKDVVFSSIGLRVPVGKSGAIEDTSLGAGAQGILMFCMLHLIDKARFRNYGWTQAAVWAIEEPESSLHRDLQLRAASLLNSYTQDDQRFQILITTHNEIFVESARSGFAVKLHPDRGSTVVEARSIRELADEAASELVTGWAPPVLKFPQRCVVLTEGPTDCRILTRAAQLTDIGVHLKFCTVSELDATFQGDGYDQIINFVKRHSPVLRNRSPRYPLLVLVDWENGEYRVSDVAKKYGKDGTRHVSRMREEWCDPAVGSTFKGIERMLSPRILEMASKCGIPGIGRLEDGGFVVADSDSLKAAKTRLCDLFCQAAIPEDCGALRPGLEWAEGVSKGHLL